MTSKRCNYIEELHTEQQASRAACSIEAIVASLAGAGFAQS